MKLIWIKRLAIWLFKLNDIFDVLVKAKQKQKADDDKYYKEIIAENTRRSNWEHGLELQEKDSTIALLEQHIQSYKDKEKEVYQREYNAKKQIKINYSIAQGIVSKVKEYCQVTEKINGELMGLKDQAETSRKRIEEK